MNNVIPRLLDAWQGKNILVVGDAMLDVFVYGKSTHMSPEAPVPIIEDFWELQTLGGAGNVAHNIVSLGGKCSVFCVAGNDTQGDMLCRLFGAAQIDTCGVVREDNRSTTSKTRISANGHQLARLDRETIAPPHGGFVDMLRLYLMHNQVDAVIISDYAKGVVQRDVVECVLNIAKLQGIKVFLDPTPATPVCEGFTAITPNLKEACALASVPVDFFPPHSRVSGDQLQHVANLIHNMWRPEQIVITLGAGGIALFDNGLPVLHVPTRAKAVFDICGAGDTVIAAYALAMVAGASPEEAAQVANIAAGVAVGKPNTAVVTQDELRQAAQ